MEKGNGLGIINIATKKRCKVMNRKIDMKELRKTIIQYIIYFIFLILVFQFVLKPGHIISGSMAPTIHTEDIVIYNRLAYIFKEPQVNDIISFKHNDTAYCKRIIGVEGDIIEFVGGDVYRNGERVNEPFIHELIMTFGEKTFEVPEGKVFVLGDNRECSWDSRHWENPYVDVENIEGKEILIIPMHKVINLLGN